MKYSDGGKQRKMWQISTNAILSADSTCLIETIRSDHPPHQYTRLIACSFAYIGVTLDGSTSLKILSDLNSILVEGTFDFLVKGLVLVVYEVHIIAERT